MAFFYTGVIAVPILLLTTETIEHCHRLSVDQASTSDSQRSCGDPYRVLFLSQLSRVACRLGAMLLSLGGVVFLTAALLGFQCFLKRSDDGMANITGF